MNQRNLPILIWILHAEDREIRHLQQVTRLDIMEGATLNPHDDGLYSTRIFGAIGNELRDKLFGKIDLKVRIMHPKIYRDLMSLRELYKKICDGQQRAIFVKSIGDYVPVDDDAPQGDTGYSFFMKNLPFMKFKRNSSVERNEKINEIERWRHRLTMKNLVVLPAGLRDVEIGTGGLVTKNEINDFYYRILAASSVIVVSDDMDDPSYDSVRRNLQNTVNELYLYIDGLVGGKRGYFRDKWLSRRVMDGTRNVITAMDASGVHLDSPNVPGFDSTVYGLYQASRALAPIMTHWLREGPLSKLISIGDTQVELVDPKTFLRTWANVNPQVLDGFISEEGMMRLIAKQEDIEARHRSVMVGDHYLALVYKDKETFKVFHSLDELPDALADLVKKKEAKVTPITLEELIYYAGYNKFGKQYTVNTRYPGTDDNSTYPTKMYVRTTTTALVLRERNEAWEYFESKDNLAAEWPMDGVYTYHDSHSPHSSRLGWSQADFDGDQKSATALMSANATHELDTYMNTRNAWVTPDGQMRATIAYDTSIMMFKNLTTPFNHVKTLSDRDKKQLIHITSRS